MGKGGLTRKMRQLKHGWRDNPDQFRKRALQDAGMQAANLAFNATPLGLPATLITGKDFDDLVGYEYSTSAGKSLDSSQDTGAEVVGSLGTATAGIVGGIVGGPAGAQAGIQGMTAAKGIYGSVDQRETDSTLDPATAAAIEGTSTAATQMYAGSGSTYGGPNPVPSSTVNPPPMAYGGYMKKKYQGGGELPPKKKENKYTNLMSTYSYPEVNEAIERGVHNQNAGWLRNDTNISNEAKELLEAAFERKRILKESQDKTPEYSNPKMHHNMFAMGGPLTEFETGGTHEMNPIGGIPQGPNASVEEGETKMKSQDYIFSDRILAPKGLLSALKLNRGKGKDKVTFAEASKAIERKYDPTGKRSSDSTVQKSIELDLNRLMGAQEAFRQSTSPEFAYGGKLPYAAGGPMKTGNPDSFSTYIDADSRVEPGTYYFGSASEYLDWMNQGAGAAPTASPSLPTTNTSVPAGRTMQGDPNTGGYYNTGQKPMMPLMPNDPTEDTSQFAYAGDPTGAEYGSIKLDHAINAANFATSSLGYAKTSKDLKDNKPKPKPLDLFNTRTKLNRQVLDFDPVRREMEAAEGRARRDISGNTGDAGDIINSNVALALNSQRARAAAELGFSERQAGLDAAYEQRKLAQDDANMTRSMQVAGWNDADIAKWLSLSVEQRNAYLNNMMQTNKNIYNISQGDAIEGEETDLKYKKRSKKNKE